MLYRVVWEIDIEANDAHGAALLAREYQLSPDSTATCFTVTPESQYQGVRPEDSENSQFVDLAEPDPREGEWADDGRETEGSEGSCA